MAGQQIESKESNVVKQTKAHENCKDYSDLRCLMIQTKGIHDS